MKHFIFALYLMSYTLSVVVITLLGFFYIRYKQVAIKYAILIDVCITLALIFDTVNYYSRLIITSHTDLALRMLIIYGLLFSNVGLAYCIALLTCEVIQRPLTKTSKIIFLATSLMALIATSLFLFLYINGHIPKGTALHTGFTLSNIFSAFWGIYFCILIRRNMYMLDTIIRPLIKGFTTAILILAPLSVITNLLSYFFTLPGPIAFSPIICLLMNLTALFLYRYYVKNNSIQTNSPPRLESITSANLEDIASEHHLTERELEIIQLVLKGFSNQEIIEKLFISTNTVKNHIYNAYKKLGIKNRYELITIVMPFAIDKA